MIHYVLDNGRHDTIDAVTEAIQVSTLVAHLALARNSSDQESSFSSIPVKIGDCLGLYQCITALHSVIVSKSSLARICRSYEEGRIQKSSESRILATKIFKNLSEPNRKFPSLLRNQAKEFSVICIPNMLLRVRLLTVMESFI